MGEFPKAFPVVMIIDKEVLVKPPYPDISAIFAAKTKRRQILAKLTWEEKVAIIEQMQLLLPKGMWKAGIPDHERPASKANGQ